MLLIFLMLLLYFIRGLSSLITNKNITNWTIINGTTNYITKISYKIISYLHTKKSYKNFSDLHTKLHYNFSKISQTHAELSYENEGDYATTDDALDYLDSQKRTLDITTVTTVTTSTTNAAEISHETHETTTATEIAIKTTADATTDDDAEVITTKTITYNGVSFNINGNELMINTPDNFTPADTVNAVSSILNKMKTISHKGFVNVTDLKDLPIYSDFIDLFTVDKKYIDGKKVTESLK